MGTTQRPVVLSGIAAIDTIRNTPAPSSQNVGSVTRTLRNALLPWSTSIRCRAPTCPGIKHQTRVHLAAGVGVSTIRKGSECLQALLR